MACSRVGAKAVIVNTEFILSSFVTEVTYPLPYCVVSWHRETIQKRSWAEMASSANTFFVNSPSWKRGQ